MSVVPSPPAPPAPHSGAAMDRALPPTGRLRRFAPWGLGGLGLLSLALWGGQALPSQPVARNAQLAPVRQGEFRDELALRARVEPLRSVQLDAQESGRVEAVFVRDGDWVEAGSPLYRLHSPEQEQLLMQRRAEVAQQLANMAAQRSAQAASLAQSRRELLQLQAAQQQAEAEYRRQATLAAQGFVSSAALDQAQRQLQLAEQLLAQTREDQAQEALTRQQSLDEMARAVSGLQGGLQLLQRAHERLQLRAPLSGRLSGFTPQLGATLQPGERLGRIDDPDAGMQLVAELDEYYLPRLQPGQQALSSLGPLRLTQTLPQVQGGKARVLLRWLQPPAAASLRPGQAVELRLQFSPPSAALLLPDGPGVQSRLYVRQGGQLLRRTVQLGRRAAGQVEVLAGLQAGEQVLISQPPHEAERLALP
ncbi:efflux RND transporter periplasmic adaptor subunit [Inhella proteolytica]|uniref:Biotin/lipoyl-binding protein n=1 Tax=Inhella proteolytica TaxID=2795029 RepID=A0A931J914_9BURK|nr:biotin/lipoyl-binding protein [Inhella proteolytica]MBH9578587.1 biotin/lipoyl-binding protein [Inhella proteolytica]